MRYMTGTQAPFDSAAAAAPESGRPRTLTVVVCAYTDRRWDEIRAAVASVRAQTRPVEQLVLVIDHNPGLLERVTAEFPDARCVPNTGPQGLSGARNTGVDLATGDVVAFLDDDAAADPDWAAALMDAYTDADVLGVGGRVSPAWQAPRPSWLPEEFMWVLGCSWAGQPQTRAEIRNPIGANMSFRRSVFTASGGFDPAIGRQGADAAGCEETEFSIRALREAPGGRVLVEPAAHCRHVVTPDRVTRAYFRRRCWAEGRSKAWVSTLVGADSALATERSYVLTTLPTGILAGLGAALRGDRSGLARAAAIIEGVALTATAYAIARARLGLRARRAA